MGQFFHVKYVIIFGVPAAFSRIDGNYLIALITQLNYPH